MKALIRLHECAGWSVPLFFANHEDRICRVEAHIIFFTCTYIHIFTIAARKPKKGQATAKQRLGKILKIHKMGMY